MPDLVPVPDAVYPAAPPPVRAELGFGGAMPPPPLHRAWLRAGPDSAQGPTRLRAAVWAPAIWSGEARGSILLLNGRTECLEKYFRVIGRLTAMGYWVASLDWRGQGMSQRRAEGIMGHVDDFAEYQEDLAAFLSWGPVRDLPGKRALLAHSMGGAIALRGMVDGRLKLDAAMFSAPFWGLGGGDALGVLARGLVFGALAFGLGRRSLPGAGGNAPGQSYVNTADFDGNVLTSDPEHWGWLRRQAEADPEMTVGAPSFAYLSAALAELRALERTEPPATPTLLLLGDGEKVVDPDAVKRWGKRAPDATLTMIPGARHEPLMEGVSRPQGKLAWSAIQGFLRRQGF